MVLTLKRWKSRSSPGIAAGAAGKKPIHMLPQGRCRISPSGGFCVSGGNPPRRKRGGAARQPVRQQRNGHKTTPGPPRAAHHGDAGWSSPPTGSPTAILPPTTAPGLPRAAHHGDAGWSSPVARQAHNLKVAGSNPAPATNTITNQPPNTAGGPSDLFLFKRPYRSLNRGTPAAGAVPITADAAY